VKSVVEVAGRRIGPGEAVFIVAEVGVNHNGDVVLAEALVDSAATAGADAVKFQSFSADELVRRGTPMAPYQRAADGVDCDQYAMLASLELGIGDMAHLKRRCDDKGLVFISTPFDPRSARELAGIGVQAIKVSSADLTDALLLEAAAALRVPLILSTGMSGIEDVRKALDFTSERSVEEVVLLHCVSAYPAPEDELNLRFIKTLQDEFGCPTGFSDHTAGIIAAPLAVAAGACLVEKHVTLDRLMQGPDHGASLEPDELRALVEGVRAAERMLGAACKEPGPEEIRNAEFALKSLVFAASLPAGTKVEISHLSAKRPADGVSPMEYESFLGRVLARPVVKDELVRDELFGTA
jgi:N,N'-diacetyllegionaminate synthase